VTVAAPIAAAPTATPAQLRLDAFCSAAGAEVFHSIVYQPQIWTPDPFDVESIHAEARGAFERLLNRAAQTPPPPSGRILLLLGESGSGKTHLMRAFRNRAHADGRGYFGYLQMTALANNYARYVLANLIDALDQPYHATAAPTSGLMRLALGLLESLPTIGSDEIQQYRDGFVPDLAARVEEYADQAITDERFRGAELDLLRALLYLLRDDARLKARVLKWLRCENLSDHDREMLGGLVPRAEEHDPLRMIVQLGRLMNAVHGASLVLCVDQLEDMFSQDEPIERFRKVMDTLVALSDAVPTAVVVVACLEDYFTTHRQQLKKPKLDRLERDPEPIRLTGQRTTEEIGALVEQRLRTLFDEQGAPFDDKAPTDPFRREHLERLAGLRTRDALDFCRTHREECVAAGAWVEPQFSGGGSGGGGVAPPLTLEQAWNEFRSGYKESPPDDESELAKVLAAATMACSPELPCCS
jgi:hypothetical protein